MSTGTLHRVILTYPTPVNLTDTTDAAVPRSWIQLARTGSFVSKRYGKFDITTNDLQMMAANFRPGVTPIDYDHLTSEVTKPGDGIAAGWLKDIELRDAGTALWGLVEWTPNAAKRIENREYRFISPSFMKDYRTPTGEKVGTKLLAAALTNLPFLPEMAAVTLGADAVFGQFALSLPAENNVLMSTVHHLAEVGQHVSFKDDPEQTPELTDDERRQTFSVKSIIGDGDDQFVRLATGDGQEFGWFRATQLGPARVANANLTPPDRQQQEDTTMHARNADDELIQLANTIARERGISLRDATIEAGRRLPALAERRRADIGAETTEDTDTQAHPVINLRDGESFFALCQRTAAERQIHLSQAIRMVSAAHPNLAEAYGRGEF